MQLRSAICISVVAPCVPISISEEHNDRTFTNLPGLPIAYRSRWVLDFTGKNIYLLFVNGYQLDVLESGIVFSNGILIEANGRNSYGLAIHPRTAFIIVS